MKLRFFTTVAELGSLTKASEILNISHSGLSKAISSLESETSLKLFRPQGRGLEITPEGQWFYGKAKDILKITDEIAIGQKTQARFTKIGLSEVIASTCAGLFASEFSEALSLMTVDVGEAEGRIVSGDLDFAIAFTPSPRSELTYLKIAELRFCASARSDLANEFAGTSDIPFAVPSAEFPQNPLGYKNRDGWQSHLVRRPKYFVSQFATALDLLREGRAAVYLPEFIMKYLAPSALSTDQSVGHASSRNTGHFVEISDLKDAASKRVLYLIKLKSSEESREMKKICKVLRKHCSQK